MSHPSNPEEGEIWHHPDSKNMYKVHSTTTDGWLRYFWWQPGVDKPNYPLYTQPILQFIGIYERLNNV